MHRDQSTHAPLIVGIGGTTRAASTSEGALAYSLRVAEALGARTLMFGGDFLARLPLFDPKTAHPTADQIELVRAVRAANGLLIATPAYHGSISGVVKNALDTLELTAKDSSPYLQDLAVGTIVTAYGWQAAGTALSALRAIVHALRGWPTPLGAALNCAERPFNPDAHKDSDKDAWALATVAEQVMSFASAMNARRPADAGSAVASQRSIA